MTATPASKVPAVIHHLLDYLPEVVAPTNAAVNLGDPGQGAKDKHVVILSATPVTQEWRNLGAHSKKEDATIRLLVTVKKAGRDTTAVMDQAYEIVDLIDQWIREEPRTTLRLGGEVCWSLLVPTDFALGVGDNLRAAAVELELTYTAHL